MIGALESVLQANKWKSSAFSRLAMTERFRSARNRHLEQMLESLRDTLGKHPLSMDENTFGKHAPNLRDGIIVASADLKQEMDGSTLEYSIQDPRGRLSLQAQLQASTLMDLDGWRIVKQSQSVDGIFLCLFPGVYKKSAKCGELSLIVKPVLITLHHESAKSLEAFQSQGLQAASKPRAKSEPNIRPHRSEGKPGDDETSRSSRRSKQGERVSVSGFPWGLVLGNPMKTLRGRQPEESSRLSAKSYMDSPGGSALEGKSKQGRSRRSARSEQKRPVKRSSGQAASKLSSPAASTDSQGLQLVSKRCDGPGKDSVGGQTATSKNAAQGSPEISAKDVRSPHRSDHEEGSRKHPSNFDDASSTGTTVARCTPAGPVTDGRIDVDIEGGGSHSYIQPNLGWNPNSVTYSDWKELDALSGITRHQS